MPFQSDKQRRWMYANEPEIAREWSDRYGAANGGGMDWAGQGGMKNYLGEQPMVNAPQNWRSGPNSPPTELAYITGPEKDLMLQANLHGSLGQGPNEGPSGIMSLDGWGSRDPGQNRAGADISSSMDTSASDAGWSAPGGSSYVASQTISPADLKRFSEGPNATTTLSSGDRSFFGMPPIQRSGGNFFKNMGRGILSMFGGVPGKIGSFLSRIDPRQLRGGMTQTEWEDARTDRRRNKSIDTILNRNAPITNRTLQNLERLKYTGTMPDVGSTQTSRAIADDFTMDDVLREYSITPNRIAELQRTNIPAYEEFDDQVALSKRFLPPASEYEGMTLPPASEYEGMFPPRDIPASEYEGMFDGIGSLDNELNTPNNEMSNLGQRNDLVTEAVVNDKQKVVIDNQMYNLKQGSKTVEEVYEAARQFDSKAWNILSGKPMSKKEFNDYIKSKGWTGKLLDETEIA